MALIRLLPSQVASNWETLKPFIEMAIPTLFGTRLDKMSNILEQLLLDKMTCWVSMRDDKLKAIATTVISEDSCSGVRNLLLYTVTSVNGDLTDNDWAEGFSVLGEYARNAGCSRLIAYTINDSLIALAQALGGDTTTRVVALEVR